MKEKQKKENILWEHVRKKENNFYPLKCQGWITVNHVPKSGNWSYGCLWGEAKKPRYKPNNSIL